MDYIFFKNTISQKDRLLCFLIFIRRRFHEFVSVIRRKEKVKNHQPNVNKYSRVPNKRTGRLLENEKKSPLYALIRNYMFINFQEKVPPKYTFIPTYTFINFFQIGLLMYITYLFHYWYYMKQKNGLWGVDKACKGLILLSMATKFSVYFHYVFNYRNHVNIAIYFGPPILLFSPIRLFVLQKSSHLYFYSVLY